MTTSSPQVSGAALIIDDDQSMCELLNDALSRHGYRTAWETSAEQAYRALQERDFDVVLTDLSMEGMNGLELCERVTASHPDLPVVVITASPEPSRWIPTYWRWRWSERCGTARSPGRSSACATRSGLRRGR